MALFIAAFALALALGLPRGALAYNVPGSAQAHVPEMTEIATGIVVQSFKHDVRPLRRQAGGTLLSTRAAPNGGPGIGAGQMPLSFSLGHRRFDTQRLDGDLDVATLFLAGRSDAGQIYFGGVIGEFGDVRTPLDNGRIEHRGAGLAFGLDRAVAEDFYLTAMLGAVWLDYDVSRGGGAITGSFGAQRQFADLSADYLTRAAGGDMTLGFGLLYVRQRNDGYAESGGATIAPFTFDHLAMTLDLRNSWGQPGGFRPYVDLSSQFRIGGSSSGATAAVPVHADRQARLMLGVERMTGAASFDVGLGANFDEDGYSGLDARLNYTFRF